MPRSGSGGTGSGRDWRSLRCWRGGMMGRSLTPARDPTRAGPDGATGVDPVARRDELPWTGALGGTGRSPRWLWRGAGGGAGGGATGVAPEGGV
jgi:hypothetical protein